MPTNPQPYPPSPAADGAKPLHIFKPGQWTSMAGETLVFTQADLAATAAAFNPLLGKAPIVLGHPASDDPAQGWVARLEANERGLFAYPVQVNPAFAQAVRQGRYGTVSAMFYRPTDAANPVPGVWYLKHVGVLGAQAPAVKGLDDPAFAGAAAGVCFAEGLALADAGPLADVPATPPTNTPNPNQEKPVTPEEKAAMLAENQRLKAQLAQAEADKRHAANVAFCESIDANQLPPVWRAVAVATLDAFDAAPAPVQFAEGEAQVPLADKFKAFLKALPAAVAFDEVADKARAAAGAQPVAFAAPAGYAVEPQALALHARVLAHQKAHPGTSYDAALAAVS